MSLMIHSVSWLENNSLSAVHMCLVFAVVDCSFPAVRYCNISFISNSLLQCSIYYITDPYCLYTRTGVLYVVSQSRTLVSTYRITAHEVTIQNIGFMYRSTAHGARNHNYWKSVLFFQIIQIWSKTKREWNILLHYMVF